MPRNVNQVSPIDAPERRRLPPLLRRAWYGLNQAFRRRIAHLGLTPDQFTTLRTVLEHEGVSQRQLTSLMSSDPNTVASLLNRMEKAGLIERQTQAQDRRANRVRLKPSGKSKYERARAMATTLQSEVLAALPADARQEFLTNLDKIADACWAAAGGSPHRPNLKTHTKP
jgi:DNA-binding MarR family transcriptional regulator